MPRGMRSAATLTNAGADATDDHRGARVPARTRREGHGPPYLRRVVHAKLTHKTDNRTNSFHFIASFLERQPVGRLRRDRCRRRFRQPSKNSAHTRGSAVCRAGAAAVARQRSRIVHAPRDLPAAARHSQSLGCVAGAVHLRRKRVSVLRRPCGGHLLCAPPRREGEPFRCALGLHRPAPTTWPSGLGSVSSGFCLPGDAVAALCSLLRRLSVASVVAMSCLQCSSRSSADSTPARWSASEPASPSSAIPPASPPSDCAEEGAGEAPAAPSPLYCGEVRVPCGLSCFVALDVPPDDINGIPHLRAAHAPPTRRRYATTELLAGVAPFGVMEDPRIAPGGCPRPFSLGGFRPPCGLSCLVARDAPHAASPSRPKGL